MSSPRPEWRHVTMTASDRPPNSLTVTSIPQHYGLQQIVQDPPLLCDGLTSAQWLSKHGATACSLTRDDVLAACHPRRPPYGVDRGEANDLLAWEEDKVPELQDTCMERPQPVAVSVDGVEAQRVQTRLHRCIEHATNRLKWLRTGSRKNFGHIPGERVCLLLDTSDGALASCGETPYRNMIKALIYDQLRHKQAVLPVACGGMAAALWERPEHLNEKHLSDFVSWSASFAFAGECNVLDGLRKVSRLLDDLDCITLMLASRPSQRSSLIVDYMRQLIVGRDISLHLVAVNCDDTTKACLHEIAEQTESGFHFYNASMDEGEFIFSQDVRDLQDELQSLYGSVSHIQQLMSGRVDLALAEKLHTVQSFNEWPQGSLIEGNSLEPRKPHVYNERPYMSSAEWLEDNSLSSLNVNIYQFLAPYSIISRSQFVAVLKKDVAAQVHKDRMSQFTWPDGSIRHVHVDSTQLVDYQCRLDGVIARYQRRISWLKADSRRVFGTLTSENILFLIDTSATLASYRVQFLEHFCQLLSDQIMHCQSFNIVCFNSDGAKFFKPGQVAPTPEHLQHVMQWALTWQCSGSCDLLSGVKSVLENAEQLEDGMCCFDSLHLVVNGCPAQDESTVLSYLAQRLMLDPVAINTVLYTDGSNQGNALNQSSVLATTDFLNTAQLCGYLQRLAHQFSGLFHWYDSDGTVTSDDIEMLEDEIATAKQFQQKAGLLREHMDQNAERYREEALDKRPPPTPLIQPAPATQHITCLPRETLSSSARKMLSSTMIAATSKDKQPPSLSTKKKKKGLSKQSRNKVIAAGGGRALSATPSHASRLAVSHDSFYLDNGEMGVSLRPPSRSGTPARPGSEASAFADSRLHSSSKKMSSAIGKKSSTQKWLKKHSIDALGLDIVKIVTSRDAGNQHPNDDLLRKPFIPSRFCVTYPHVDMGSSTYHLQLSVAELDAYIVNAVHAMTGYVRRLTYLLSGSRQVFGNIQESKICVLVDLSGSVANHIGRLKAMLMQLLEDQVLPDKKRCCLLAFNSDIDRWNDDLEEMTETLRARTVDWIKQLEPSGSTDTLNALKAAYDLPGVEAVYLLTDGLPDHGSEHVVQCCEDMCKTRAVPIHAIPYPSTDSDVVKFLKSLSSVTHGRCEKPIAQDLAVTIMSQLASHLHHRLKTLADAGAMAAGEEQEVAATLRPYTDDLLGPSPQFNVQALVQLMADVSVEKSKVNPLLPTSGQDSRLQASSGQMSTATDATSLSSPMAQGKKLTVKKMKELLRCLRGVEVRPICTEILALERNYALALKCRSLAEQAPEKP